MFESINSNKKSINGGVKGILMNGASTNQKLNENKYLEVDRDSENINIFEN